jgi:hypothetical protein
MINGYPEYYGYHVLIIHKMSSVCCATIKYGCKGPRECATTVSLSHTQNAGISLCSNTVYMPFYAGPQASEHLAWMWTSENYDNINHMNH